MYTLHIRTLINYMGKKRSVIWTVSKNRLQQLLDESQTMVEVMKILGLKPYNGNHRTLNRRILEDGLDLTLHKTNHDKFRKENMKKSGRLNKRHNDDIFIENSTADRGSIKSRLVTDFNFEYKCYRCGIDSYNDEPISLQLDHINGINNDNRINNLRFLCPNCHSQTPTFAGRSSKVTHHCPTCGDVKLTKIGSTCRKCVDKKKKFDPTYDELFKVVCVDRIPFTTLGKQYGVSDNAVRKRCTRLGIDPKNREKFTFQ